MDLESKRQILYNQPGVGIVQTEIKIVGLKPEQIDPRSGQVVKESNLEELQDQLRSELRVRPWLKELYRDLRRGHKSAIVTVALGSIVITTAIGAGFEFGIRHGKDVKEIIALIKKKPVK